MFKNEILISLCCLFLGTSLFSLNVFFHLFTFSYSQATKIEENIYFQIKLSVDIMSSQSESVALVVAMWEAFTSNLLVEEFSHSSSKNPKHL